MGTIFPFFQSLGTLPGCRDLSNAMESGLATPSASSLRTVGCISSGPTDLCMFRFLTWPQTSSSLTVGVALPPWSPSCGPSTLEGWEVASEDWGKKVVEHPSPLFVYWYEVTIHVHQGAYAFFNLPFLVDILVEALLVILCIPCQIQLILNMWLLSSRYRGYQATAFRQFL